MEQRFIKRCVYCLNSFETDDEFAHCCDACFIEMHKKHEKALKEWNDALEEFLRIQEEKERNNEHLI